MPAAHITTDAGNFICTVLFYVNTFCYSMMGGMTGGHYDWILIVKRDTVDELEYSLATPLYDKSCEKI